MKSSRNNPDSITDQRMIIRRSTQKLSSSSLLTNVVYQELLMKLHYTGPPHVMVSRRELPRNSRKMYSK